MFTYIYVMFPYCHFVRYISSNIIIKCDNACIPCIRSIHYPPKSSLLLIDISLANPITEVTDVGKSNIRVVIATTVPDWAYAHDTTKVPNTILLKA